MIKSKQHEVIDNFLDKDSFYNIKNKLESEELNWFYKDNMVSNSDDYCFFSHNVFLNHKIASPVFDKMIPLFEKLNATSLINVRANMLINTGTPYESSWHIDYNLKNSKTAVFYINTCNGKTVIDNNKKIKIDSVENRVLIFNSNIKHKAISSTNTKRRIVININYFVE